MSILNDQFHFLKALPVAMSASQLDIPETPADAGRGQGYMMHVGDRFLVYSLGRRMEGHYIVVGWLEEAEDQPRKVHLRNVISNTDLFLTLWQVSTLEAQRRLRPVSLAGSTEEGISPGLALAMDDRRRSKAERYLGYVRASLDLFSAENNGRRSKRLVKIAIREHAEAIGDEKPPCYDTVLDRIKAYECRGCDPLFDLADKPKPGNPRSEFGDLVEKVMRDAVQAAWELPNGTWETVKSVFRAKIARMRKEGVLPPEDAEDDIRIPKDRTFQRRMYQANLYDRVYWRSGPEEANRRMARYIRQALPDFPLDIVDVDHTTFNIVVIDDRYPVAYGRPDLLVFRDRRTGDVLGYSLAFENPSYESFLHGLRHAIFPKDMSAFPGRKWAHGRPFRLGVDNALHLIGDNIEAACQQLDIQLVEYRPGHPWEKGALERLNGILGQRVALGLPGATGANPSQRDSFDDSKQMAMPELTLSEVEAVLEDYFHIYRNKPQAGLGFLRTLKGVPAAIWEQDIKLTPDRPPLDPNIFVRLAGDVNYCTIQSLGIRLDHIFYQSEELLAMTAHPDHKDGEGRHRGTRYRVVRDLGDLGHAWVWDPYRKVTIEVQACSADYSYANGLRLFQHRAIVKYWNEKHGQPANAAELQKAMDEYQLGLVEFHQRRRKHGTASKLARFMSQQGRKIARSRLVEAVTSPNASSERLNVAEPLSPAPMEPRSSRASPTAVRAETGGNFTVATYDMSQGGRPVKRDPVPKPARSKPSPTPAARRPPEAQPSPMPDIEFLKSKHEGYD